MTSYSESSKPERPHTYFVQAQPHQQRKQQEELERLTIQDQMLTQSLGGVFPEQPDPMAIESVLDIACGTGTWLLEAARSYPHISKLVGVDINSSFIAYARAQAEAAHLQDRVEFQVADATVVLDFSLTKFDLVNLRLGSSFLRKMEWGAMIEKMEEIAQPGKGVVRIVDAALGVQHSTSPALTKIGQMSLCAMERSMHLFSSSPTSVIDALPTLLERYMLTPVHTQPHTLIYQGATPAGDAFCEDMRHLFSTGRSFLEKYGCISSDYDALCQQALLEMHQPDFMITWEFLVMWATRSENAS